MITIASELMVDFECGFEESFPQEEEPLEERSLNLLKDSAIDQAFAEAKAKKKGGKKHKVKWMRRPTVMPEAILEFLDEDLRENAIRYLSNFLMEKRGEDPGNYNRAGFLLFFSCSTMPTLLQEIVSFYRKMSEETLNVRSIKRLANVLTLFQCIAANNGTRQKLVNACIPDYLIPLIQFECTIDVFENIRAIALSVIGILCQAGESFVIDWAIKSNLVEVCHTILATASELNKVICSSTFLLKKPNYLSACCRSPELNHLCLRSQTIAGGMVNCRSPLPCIFFLLKQQPNFSAIPRRNMTTVPRPNSATIAMHILESIIRDSIGISYLCNPSCNLLNGLMNTWDDLVNLLSVDPDFSPRLLFHILRCYVVLCSNERGCAAVVQRIPVALTDGSFCGMIEEFPIIGGLLVQLLLYADKEDACLNDLCSPDFASVPSPATPCRSIDLGTTSMWKILSDKIDIFDDKY